MQLYFHRTCILLSLNKSWKIIYCHDVYLQSSPFCTARDLFSVGVTIFVVVTRGDMHKCVGRSVVGGWCHSLSQKILCVWEHCSFFFLFFFFFGGGGGGGGYFNRQWIAMNFSWHAGNSKIWASSTGFTAVSKSMPSQPAQWAIGTHCKGPSRMKV